MGAPTTGAPGGPTTVVAAFLDGRRLKGYVFGFSALRDHCAIFPSPVAKQGEGEDINLKQLKAIFFIHEPSPEQPVAPTNPGHGRKIDVTFSDGERLEGTTEGYTKERLGFFMVPHDPGGKILRIFVINANVSNVRWVQ